MKAYTVCREDGSIIGIMDFEEKPPFSTEKLYQGGFLTPKLNFENDEFYEGATELELTDYRNFLENAEDESIILQLIEDGNELYKRHKERLRRRVLKGNMTLADSKAVRKLLREAHSYLRNGDYDIALDLSTLIVGQPNKIQAEVTWLIEKINLNLLAK